MAKILGLDLGTNSIGWAIIDDSTRQILGTGVRIFPEGVNRDTKGSEVSKNADRRIKRQTRRQFFRRGLRKQKLVEILMPLGMFPNMTKVKEELQQLKLRTDLREFFLLDAYQLRARAASGDKLSLMEVGRVFYHLSQRRGYRENLQVDMSEEGTLMKGDAEQNKIGIDATKAAMGDNTLGQYLASLNPHEVRIRNRYTLRSMYINEFNKIFEQQQKHYPTILTDELKEKLGAPNKGVIFFQRELRNQKFLRGACTFEPNKTRIAASSPWFESFRMFQMINTVRNGQRVLDNAERGKFIELCLKKDKFTFEDFKKSLKTIDTSWNYEDKHSFPGCKTIAAIIKAFGKKEIVDHFKNLNEEKINTDLIWLDDIWHIKQMAKDTDWFMDKALNKWGLDEKQAIAFKKFRLSTEFGSVSHKVIANVLPYLIKGLNYDQAIFMAGVRNAFGNKWKNLSDADQQLAEDNVLANAYTDDDDLATDKVKKILTEHFKLSEKDCTRLYHHSDNRQSSGNTGNSIEAVQAIKNPIVQAALFEVNSLLPKLIEQYGKPDEVKIEMARELKKSKKQRQEERFRNWDNERENDACRAELDKLGLAHTRDNVQRMWLWRECKHMCPYSGREISVNQLFNDGSWQIEHIIPYSVSLDDSLTNKTLCEAGMNKTKGQRTPYEAFSDSSEWQNMISRAYKYLPYHKAQRFVAKKHDDLDGFIERQLNDTRYIARASKGIVERIVPKVNITQGGLTAMLRQQWGLNGILNHRYKLNTTLPEGEYYAAIDGEDEIVEDCIRRWNHDPKVRKSIQEELKKHGRVLKGMVRDEFFLPSKSRDDHRHHAIDAIAVACSKVKFLQEASRLKGKGMDGEQILTHMRIDEPWDGFWHQAKEQVEGILVSFKNRKRTLTNVSKPLFDKNSGKPIIKDGVKWKGQGMAARGELHKATYYGNYTHSDEKEYLHERVDLDSRRTKAHIDQIVDDGVRDAVLARLTAIGIDVHQPKFKIPEDTAENPIYFKKDDEGKKIPLVFLPNQNGAPIPIKKVRIHFPSSNKVQLHGVNRFVEPGNNHHVVIYEKSNGEMEEQIVTFWQVLERKRQKQNVYQLPFDGKKIITILQINHLFLLGLSEDAINWDNPDMELLSDRLYRVQKLSSLYYQFRHHLASTIDYDVQMKRVASFKAFKAMNPIKVRIDRTGKLTRI